MNAIVLSIVIPVYNVESWPGECLDSLLPLENDSLEVIVLNDGTTDNSRAVAEKYENSFKNFVIIDQVNQGLSMARNSGLSIAQGKYVYFLDSDDYIDAKEFKSFLDQAIMLDVDIAVGNGRHLEGETLKHVLMKPAKVKNLGVVDGPSYYISANKYNEFHVAIWLKLYKKSFLQDSNLVFLANSWDL